MNESITNESPKSIVLFSDGTGNSSAKLIRTNVWRTYEAVDLGPPAKGYPTQIAYYDDGVGTSSFRPLAVLGGAFGWGLKRNVLDIYQYTCRNYRPGVGQSRGNNPNNLGDRIYGFGFSRGAFTMRVVIALIASQGLVESSNEGDLERKTREAYREFRKDFLPRKWQAPTRLVRWILRQCRRALTRRHDEYKASDNYQPVIQFIGVWDTVSAYGGPFAEITRAIDNWIFPLSMPDYRLHENVQCARHALALDDERESFHPLLWDELHEANRGRRPERLQQVWFTGMHSDVGGGYPDESLSYVSLLWMLEEAEKEGLRTLKYITARYHALANSYGPIHDSRSGVGSYYRYQPRKLNLWLHPVDPTTLSLRDPLVMYPTTTDDGKAIAATDQKRQTRRGLLLSTKVHESVIARITAGTDRYAPITLPKSFEIVPQRHGETQPQVTNDQNCALLSQQGIGRPMVPAIVREILADDEVLKTRSDAMEVVWDWVWARRVTYFATVVATLLLVGMPFFGAFEPPILIGIWLTKTIKLFALVLPDFADFWIECFAGNPSWVVILAAGIVILRSIGSRIERNLRDKAREIWDDAILRKTSTADSQAQRVSSVRRFRSSVAYQRVIHTFKWGILPRFFGVVLGVLAVWIAAGIAAQLRLPYLENGTDLCDAAENASVPITVIRTDFTTRSTCHPLGTMKADTHYMVSFEVLESWQEGSKATTPVGLKAAELGMQGYGLSLFRRVFDERYLAPVIQIRSPNRGTGFGIVQLYPLNLKPSRGSMTTYSADFVPSRDGEAALFANDAVWPFAVSSQGVRYFYEGGTADPYELANKGNACVTIVREDQSVASLPEASTPVCRELAEARAKVLAGVAPSEIVSHPNP